MRTLGAWLLGCALVVVVGFNVLGDEKKEEPKKVTLKGTIGCSKCEFKLTDDCGTAIKVKEGDKEVVYLVLDEGKKAKYHGMICTDTKKGSVTGVVGMKGDQKTIKPDKDGVKFE
jgi:Family of unknown function (DUF6370)